MSVRRATRRLGIIAFLFAIVAAGHGFLDVPAGGTSAWAADSQLAPAEPGTGCGPLYPVRLNGATWDGASELLLASNDLVRFRVCSAGTLNLTAHGSTFHGTGPHLVVSLGARTVWEGEVADPVGLEIEMPGPGWVGIAFVNDRYEPPEDRNLWLERLAFEPRP